MAEYFNDADIEMAELAEAGTLYARRVRRFGKDGYARMERGETIWITPISKDTGMSYAVQVRLDGWEGPILHSYVEYSIDGKRWYSTAREARRASEYSTVSDREQARKELQQQYPDGVTRSPDA